MMITKNDKEYIINSKLKVLEGKKNRYLNNDPEMLELIDDINAQIEALTNCLKMI